MTNNEWQSLLDEQQEAAGRVDGKQRPASQVAWELHHGKPFPAGMDACHTCDNPPCVRPDHIFPGTPVDNAKDALAKCRLKCGRVAPLKSHCKHGHGFTDDNTLVRATTGHRSCRTCRDLRNWRRYGGL